MKTKNIFATLVILAISFSSCKKDETSDPPANNPSELITTLRLVFTDTLTNTVRDTLTFRDADGAGGNLPQQDSLLLDAGSVYNVSVLVLDESKNPADTISNEIEEEAEVHRFVYSADPSTGFLDVQVTDLDANNKPVGLSFLVNAGAAGVGKLRVALRHYNTEADKINDNGNYDTDIDVTFGARLQ